MKVSQLAKRAGVTPDTVRHYVKIDLLKPQRNPENGYREFGPKDLSRLKFIRGAQRLGFHLDEIRSIFASADGGHSACPEVRGIIARRIDETRKTIVELQNLQQRMERAAAGWADLPDRAPDGHSVCHLIERWEHDDER